MMHVFLLRYPNGKVYVGYDLTGDPTYVPSPKSHLAKEELKLYATKGVSLTVEKTILLETEDRGEARRIQTEQIRNLASDKPEIGYNQHQGKLKTKVPSIDVHVP